MLVKALEAVISVVAVTGSNEPGYIPKIDDNISSGEYRLEVEAMDHLRIAACGLSGLRRP